MWVHDANGKKTWIADEVVVMNDRNPLFDCPTADKLNKPNWLDTTETDEAKMDYSSKTNDELRQMEVEAVAKSLAKNRQEGGNHYKHMAIQPYEYCHKNNLGYCESNIIKYVSRWKNKNGVEDLKKARHMLDLLIEEVADAD